MEFKLRSKYHHKIIRMPKFRKLHFKQASLIKYRLYKIGLVNKNNPKKNKALSRHHNSPLIFKNKNNNNKYLLSIDQEAYHFLIRILYTRSMNRTQYKKRTTKNTYKIEIRFKNPENRL